MLSLYWVFFQIGALAFGGGYATLPLIQSLVVEQRGWLTIREMTDVVSISNMTPGPIAINAATFVGTKIHGLPGSIVATAGVVTPQFILMMVLAYFIFKDYKIDFLSKMLGGLRPGVVGLIAVAAISMARSSLFTTNIPSVATISPTALLCFAVGFVLYARKMDIIKVVGISAAIGIVCHIIF